MTDVMVAEADKGRAQSKRERCTADVRKRAIMDAATDVFLERGYAGASIDAVVERAGGSKASVYAMFGNKLGLLEALVSEGAEALAAAVDHLPLDQPVERSLKDFAMRFLQLILQPRRLALFRLVVGESGRLPELGDVFYRTGPEKMVEHLADFFRAVAQRGQISAPEPDRLARYFIGAIRADFHFRALFNATRMPTTKEVAQHIDFVVEIFLKELACAAEAPHRAD